MPSDPTKNAALAQGLILQGLSSFLQGQENLDKRKQALEKELTNRKLQDIELAANILKGKGQLQESALNRGSREKIAGQQIGAAQERLETQIEASDVELGKKQEFQAGQTEKRFEHDFEKQKRQHAHEKEIAKINANTSISSRNNTVTRAVTAARKEAMKNAGDSIKVELKKIGIQASNPSAAITRIDKFLEDGKVTPEQAVKQKNFVAATVLKQGKAVAESFRGQAESAINPEQAETYRMAADQLEAALVSEWSKVIGKVSSTEEPTRTPATAAEGEILDRPLPDFSKGQ